MANHAFRKRLVFIALGGVLLVPALAAGKLLLESRSRSQPLPGSVLEGARVGVSHNGDWKPAIRTLDGLDMALVPAACFPMGSTTLQLPEATDSCERFFGVGKCQVDFGQSETPAHEVCFDRPFWIGETEVTNREYGSSSSTDMVAMYRGPSWPRETVTWNEASQFCSAHDARLPTEAEWELAARGPDGLIYPWGDAFDPERLVSGRLSPADVGSVPAGVSWVGAFDMSGGVAEWVEDRYDVYVSPHATAPEGPADTPRRVVRGGSWFSFASFYLRAAHRESAAPDTANSTIGFRCARDLDGP
ncbi:MAG: SUMF1/EgtB/PvdO family nonheme iron enzyme [Anaerolineales bacterium]